MGWQEAAEVSSSSNSEPAAQQVTSKNPVLMYRNIDELQRHNQQLLRLVHELSEKKQSEEKLEFEERIREYDDKLNMAIAQLDEFRAQREKQEQILDEIRKQRDTYKHLLNQQQQQQQQQQLQFCTSTPGDALMRTKKPMNMTAFDDDAQRYIYYLKRMLMMFFSIYIYIYVTYLKLKLINDTKWYIKCTVATMVL